MPGENAQEAGLAAAVPANEADLLARSHGQSYGFKEALMAIGQGEVVGGQQSGTGSHLNSIQYSVFRISISRIPDTGVGIDHPASRQEKVNRRQRRTQRGLENIILGEGISIAKKRWSAGAIRAILLAMSELEKRFFSSEPAPAN